MTDRNNEQRTRASVVAGLDACAVSIPMTLGGSVILYSQIAPEWLGPGVLAGCLGYALVHALGAHVQRPVVCAARFFEAATVAAMVQQLGASSAAWGLADTAGTRVAVAICIATLAGLIAGVLWLLRAERFARFVPAPVYLGFTSAIVVLLVTSQTSVLARQTAEAGHVGPIALAAAVIVVGLAVRRWRPRLPPAAVALVAGAVGGAALVALDLRLPMLTQTAVWTLPVFLADFSALTAAGVKTGALGFALAQNAAVLGILLFLNTVVTGQILAQTDDRQTMLTRDRVMQALGFTLAGAAGSSPLSGAPNVALVVGRSPKAMAGPAMLWTMVVAVCLLYVTQALAFVPLAALVGVFLFDAWQMWDRPTWRNLVAYLSRQNLPAHAREDLLVIGAVMVASLAINMVAALLTGLVLGLLLHAHRNTRKPVRAVWSGLMLHSQCARSRTELALLQAHGDRIRVFELDSQQFFASAGLLNASVRTRLDGIDCAVLDWSAVRDIDTSVVMVVTRLEAFAPRHQVVLLHAGLQDDVLAMLRPHVASERLIPDLDHALERAENLLIVRHGQVDQAASEVSEAGLLRGLNEVERGLVLQSMSWREHAPGDALVRVGEPGDELVMLLEGNASVVLARDGASPVRLSGLRGGTTVGEVGFLEQAPRSATVLAETLVRVRVMTRATFDTLAEQHPQLVQRLLTNMALDLAARLRHLSSRVASKSGSGG